MRASFFSSEPALSRRTAAVVLATVLVVACVFVEVVAAALRVEPIAANTALAVKVRAGKDECFFEEVRVAGINVFWHFEVVAGGDLDIDAKILAPDGQLIWTGEREHDARTLFRAQMTGDYQFCLSNKMSSVTAKTVAFSVLAGESTASIHHQSDPIERMTTHIMDGLTEVKNEQQFLRTRERAHRDTTESTNTRVVIFSLFEIAVFVAVSAFQILHLKRAFEKRRNV